MAEDAQDAKPAVRRKTPEATWEDVATGLLPVLACFLGGATEKWAEGIVVAFLGLLLLLNPPRFSLGLPFHLILLALLACAAIAFLPSEWFFQSAWREALMNDFGIPLPGTVSPQPWITAGCLLSFAAGLCWLYYVGGQEVEIRAHRRQLRIFAIGIILLALVAIVLHLKHSALPFWHNQRGFGPFPNRNQTANLLGLTSILLVACAHNEIRQGRKGWIFWLAGLGVLFAAIILNFSRAGIALLLVGSALWMAVLVVRSGSTARIAIGASALLVLLTLLLVFGGQTFERFNLRGAGSDVSSDFRWLIFHDTLDLIRASPWCGVGLGNFQPVFAIFRNASVGQTLALHPESDWLWLCAEIGWPGVLLILAGGALLVCRVFPFREGTNQWFRTAALVALFLFALHGLVDVAGHRVGTAYAGMFLFGMALRRPMRTPASAWLTNSFRSLGLILFALGMTWLVAVYRGVSLPGALGADTERRLAAAANVGRLSEETIRRATRGLEWAPLDWQLYFLRALGKVGANRPPGDALDDFRRARFLEPNSFEVPYQEGVAWLPKQPLLAVTAWRDALRRAGPQRPELYNRMLSSASPVNPAVHAMLEEFGSREPDLLLAYLERTSGEKFTSALNRFLEVKPHLQEMTSAQKARLFSLWAERGDLAHLGSFTQERPELLEFAWRGVANHQASKRDFRGACETTARFAVRPALPQVESASVEQLQKRLFSNPNNYEVGFALYQQQMQEGKTDDALITLRRLSEQPGCPAYFHFLEAEAWAAKQEWERAWNAWRTYDAAARK
ncbi:MAG: O-antigen ligase family protein [Chthoniobacterales bacterium]